MPRRQFLCRYWRHVQPVHGLHCGQVFKCRWRQLVKHLCCVSQQHLLARGQWQHHLVHLQQGLLWARRARMCCLCCRQVQGCQRQRSHSDARLPRLHCRQVFKHIRCKFVKLVCGLSQWENIECIERRPRRLRAMTRQLRARLRLSSSSFEGAYHMAGNSVTFWQTRRGLTQHLRLTLATVTSPSSGPARHPGMSMVAGPMI